MIVFKISGIILIIFSSALAGFLKSRSLVLRYKELELIYNGVQVLYEQINHGGRELEKAIKYSFLKCNFLVFQGEKFYYCDNNLTKDDKVLIDEFFASLGHSVKKSECERIRLFEANIKKQLIQAQEDVKQKCRLYQTLGVCVGLAISIFFV